MQINDFLKRENGNNTDANIILKKELTNSAVNKGQGPLAFPEKDIVLFGVLNSTIFNV